MAPFGPFALAIAPRRAGAAVAVRGDVETEPLVMNAFGVRLGANLLGTGVRLGGKDRA